MYRFKIVFDMAKETKKIGVFITAYTLFLYYLINGVNEKDIIICTHNVPKKIKENIKHISLPYVSFNYGAKMAPLYSINGIFKNIIGYCKYFYGYLKLRILLFFKCFNKNVEVWGQTHSPFSYMFYTYDKAYMIEDGLMNYSLEPIETHKINSIVDFILHLFGIYFLNIRETLGTHKNIKKIYLTQECVFDIIRDKVITINIEKLWNEKSIKEQNKILKIFNVDINSLNQINKDYKLLLTQPFFENNILPLNEEIGIYKKLLGTTEKIIIKPHPNDEKNYNELFPDAIIINKEFPIELMELIGIRVDNVYTINTTAVLNFKNSNIHIFKGKTSSNELNKSIIQLKKMCDKL